MNFVLHLQLPSSIEVASAIFHHCQCKERYFLSVCLQDCVAFYSFPGVSVAVRSWHLLYLNDVVP